MNLETMNVETMNLKTMNLETEHQLDARRYLCPLPVIKTQDKIKTLKTGDRLTVYCTDPGVLHDIPAWCRINGHQVEQAEKVANEYIVVVKVN